jgi:hypothetical protein
MTEQLKVRLQAKSKQTADSAELGQAGVSGVPLPSAREAARMLCRRSRRPPV